MHAHTDIHTGLSHIQPFLDVLAQQSSFTHIQTLRHTCTHTHTRTHIHTQIRVYCRVKPHPSPVMRCLPDQIGVSIAVDGKEHGFGYDRVFNPAENQEEVSLFSRGICELLCVSSVMWHALWRAPTSRGSGEKRVWLNVCLAENFVDCAGAWLCGLVPCGTQRGKSVVCTLCTRRLR
jgi:hypothetical protein